MLTEQQFEQLLQVLQARAHPDILDQRFEQLLQVLQARAHPDIWLDAAGVGGLLGYTGSQVQQRICAMRGFPKPARFTGKGHPRWKRSEIMAWADSQR